MSTTTITTVKGNSLNSFIVNDKNGKPVGFGAARVEGTYGKGGMTKFGFLVFHLEDKDIHYAEGVDGFVKAVKSGRSKAGKDFQLEIFVEKEQFDLVKVKWVKDASLAACIDSESELDRLYKTVKTQKGWVWDAFVGKTDKDRKSELASWLKDDQFKQEIMEDYGVVNAPRRPTTPKRPAK